MIIWVAVAFGAAVSSLQPCCAVPQHKLCFRLLNNFLTYKFIKTFISSNYIFKRHKTPSLKCAYVTH